MSRRLLMIHLTRLELKKFKQIHKEFVEYSGPYYVSKTKRTYYRFYTKNNKSSMWYVSRILLTIHLGKAINSSCRVRFHDKNKPEDILDNLYIRGGFNDSRDLPIAKTSSALKTATTPIMQIVHNCVVCRGKLPLKPLSTADGLKLCSYKCLNILKAELMENSDV